MVEKLNRTLIGWANYFCLGAVSQAYSAVDVHARRRLRRWLCDKYEEARPGYKRFPEASLHSVYGLVQLLHFQQQTQNMLRILPIRLLFTPSLAPYLRCHAQLELQFR